MDLINQGWLRNDELTYLFTKKSHASCSELYSLGI